MEKSGYNVPVSEKTDWLKIRITPADKKWFAEVAKEERLSLSAWVVTNLAEAARRKKPKRSKREP